MPPRKPAAKRHRRPLEVVERAPNYTKYYVTNVRVLPTDVDIRLEIFNERIPHEKHFDLIADAGVILTPEAASVLRDRLAEALKQFEEKHGAVVISPTRSKGVRSNNLRASP